jgi:hypothetical protein
MASVSQICVFWWISVLFHTHGRDSYLASAAVPLVSFWQEILMWQKHSFTEHFPFTKHQTLVLYFIEMFQLAYLNNSSEHWMLG